jgi:hypothetical protein
MEAVETGQGSVSVWIYDYAGTDRETLHDAKARASKILERADIAVQWVDCPLSAAERDSYPGCKPELHPVRLVVRLRAGMPPDQGARARSAFGFAHVPHSGGPGFLADVYLPGADLLAGGDTRERGSMLGHLIAHELGHLLLGTTRHAASGIMRSPFTSREIERARHGALLFNTEEARRLIASVRSRAQSINNPEQLTRAALR